MIGRLIDRLYHALRPRERLVVQAREGAKDPEGPEEVVRQGQRAERLLSDNVFQRAVRNAEDAYVTAWKDATDPEERDQMWYRQAALEQVLHELRVFVNNSDFEQHEGQ